MAYLPKSLHTSDLSHRFILDIYQLEQFKIWIYKLYWFPLQKTRKCYQGEFPWYHVVKFTLVGVLHIIAQQKQHPCIGKPSRSLTILAGFQLSSATLEPFSKVLICCVVINLWKKVYPITSEVFFLM